MKKILIISIVFIMLAAFASTTVKAVSASTLPEDLYNLGKEYKVTEADKARGERYIKDNPITDEQAEEIYAKAQEAVAILKEAGATDVKKLDTQLNADQRSRFKAICQEAADVFGVILVYKNGTVEIYKDGKKIDVYTFADEDKLSYTGNNVNIVLVVSVIALVSITTAFIVRKKLINV